MTVAEARKDFPLLTAAGAPVYFDNACQSLRPRPVLAALADYYEKDSACAGRSMHRLSAAVNRRVERVREQVAQFINAGRPEEVVFLRNTTEGINLVARSLGLQAGDAVVISDKEHNSNLIPWQMLKKARGVAVKIVASQPDNTFDLDAFQKVLDPSVKLVSFGLTSNLDGVTVPAKEIVKLAHAAGALVLLDAAQAAAHQPLDVRALDVDFLAFSGHKVLGPSGTGVLYGKYHLLEKLEPFLVGGDTVEISTYETCQFLPPPHKFEAGLQDYAGIYGLGAAVEYLQQVGFAAVQKQESSLNEYVTGAIKDIPNLKIIGPADPQARGGIISFYIEGKDAHQIALLLDETAQVMVRSGQHCVHSWFGAHGLKGSVRVSLAFYNTQEEAERFVAALKKIISIL